MKTIPSLSVDAQALARVLGESPVGEVVTYDALSKAIGRDVRSARGLLYTAVRTVMRDSNAVFAAVRGVGLKRLESTEIVSVATQTVRHIRKASGRAMQKLACTDLSKLNESQKVSVFTHNSLLGALRVMSCQPSIKKLTEAVNSANAELPIAKTLALFQ